MQRIIRKSIEISLIIEKRLLFWKYNKVIKLKFKQATVMEAIDFGETIKGNMFNIVIWLLDFITKHSDKKITKKDKQYIMVKWGDILDLIKKYYLWFDKKNETKGENPPFSSYITILSEKTWLHPLALMENYTFEQLEWITEWLVWNANETSKEWQRKNKLFLVKQRAENRSEEENQKIKQILSTISW